MIERSYSEKFAEHSVAVNGQPIATAHKLAGDNWSVKIGSRFVGIAKSEKIAIAELDRIAKSH